MELQGIISIAGRPGLFKIITQGKSTVIVESLIDKKRFPAFASEKISSIEDISIFTTDEDVKLTEVFSTMLKTYEGNESISHKTEEKELRKAFEGILKNYDYDRVYLSDIRKVFQWYNLLLKQGLLKEESDTEDTSNKELKKVKTDSPKKASKSLATKEQKVAKATVSKKTPVVKTGSSRGK